MSLIRIRPTFKYARSIAILLAGLATLPAVAQTWPAKPVRVIVPYPAGGVVDIQTRAVALSMAADLGQPFLVESRPGANANIGAEAVARAAADGYTLLIAAPFILTNPLLESNLRWQPTDFAPVARFSVSPSFFVVPANSPAHSVKEFVEYARKNPGLQYGDGGPGTTQTMANEMFKAVAGLKLDAVAYKGAPPIVPDLINGLISMAIVPSTVAIPPIKAGKLRVLANVSDKRSPLLPDVPTIAEAGYPEVTVLSWYGFYAPAGTPPAIIARIVAAVRTAAATQEVRDRHANAGGETAFLGGPEFDRFLRDDKARWERFVKVINKQ